LARGLISGPLGWSCGVVKGSPRGKAVRTGRGAGASSVKGRPGSGRGKATRGSGFFASVRASGGGAWFRGPAERSWRRNSGGSEFGLSDDEDVPTDRNPPSPGRARRALQGGPRDSQVGVKSEAQDGALGLRWRGKARKVGGQMVAGITILARSYSPRPIVPWRFHFTVDGQGRPVDPSAGPLQFLVRIRGRR